MTNLAKLVELAEDEHFRRRVRAAAVIAALQVSGESTNAADERSQARQRYATQVLQGAIGVQPFAFATAANPSILQTYVDSEHSGWSPPTAADQASIPDGDIEYTMATIWDDLSGAARIAAE